MNVGAQLTAFGPALDVLHVTDVPRPQPEAGELLLEMLAAPINPADLNIIEGKYGTLPELPAVIGNEGVGRVAEIGLGVEGFAVGDLVLPMRTGTWTQFMLVQASEVIWVPPSLDIFQASMLTVNPPTAWGLLGACVQLQPSDWVVQNAANSAVGRCVIQLAKSRGVKTLNIVRRPELVEELLALGADAVVTEETDLREQVKSLCGGARPKLALNAVGGASALNLANALADGGVHVTYGAMGRQPLKIPNGLLIFRGLSFQGFWLNKWKDGLSADAIVEAFVSLARLSIEGKLHMPVHKVFPLAEIQAAVAEASGEKRAGKVILDLRG